MTEVLKSSIPGLKMSIRNMQKSKRPKLLLKFNLSKVKMALTLQASKMTCKRWKTPTSAHGEKEDNIKTNNPKAPSKTNKTNLSNISNQILTISRSNRTRRLLVTTFTQM